ncbi:uncharacterized protein LOC114126045 isoform X3 [Aphis gossypii]|uniref:uncharacterized protein LOC114126045 isoform X3 n=1 Tax=Aphis gossypii TaxID=80765 RepID=UPI00215906B1|nr:uncharacterized protein LOC114126045 isoform X3 [Aphis gossypii]
MEGVPRLYMIGLPAKRCVDNQKPNFSSALNHEIQTSYDRDPSFYSADIDTLLALRKSAMSVVMSSACNVEDCTALKRYYAHLVRLTDKFPKLLQQQNSGLQESYDDVETGTARESKPLMFKWKRALGGKTNLQHQMKNNMDSTSVVDTGDIGYEMRCVLYNVGAAHSRLAAAQDRSPPLVSSSMPTTVDDGEIPSNNALKIACTHLQCAAWAFQQLLGGDGSNNEQTKWNHRQQPQVTSRAVLEFAYNVTLAQAQECILEKSMMDGRKPLIIAKVSAMICEYFAGAVDAVQRVEQEPYCVSTSRLEKWRLFSEFKCRYYGAVTALFQGQHVQDQLQQMGTRVSYYRRAVNLLGRAGLISESGGKTAASMSKDEDSADDDYYYYLESEHGRPGTGRSAAAKELEMRRDTLSFAMDVAAAKWRAAKSENELIYHEPVVPVLSDDDDSDCLGNTSSKTTHGRQLEKVKGASLVKPIAFSVDDPELLAVVLVTNNNESSSVTTTTLFKDLVPTVTRHRAAMYRTEKGNLKEDMQSLCQEADDRLNEFSDTLHLECLEMYKTKNGEFSDGGYEKNDVTELPQQLVNCCAAYQALLQQRQEKDGITSSAVEEDQLDIDMARLSAAVQAVDGMLDEIDRFLKTEELGDSEYRRTVGRPYDYSAGRMRELRREASRYREAHVGRARDSWVTLSRAVRDRRRRDLELLALPPAELAARLPPARPAISAIASEVAASGSVEPSYDAAIESSDQNEDSESDDGGDSRLRMLQRESIKRLDRLNMVVSKMKEVREQRQTLLTLLQDEMNREDKEAAAAGQDDAEFLGELGGCNVDVMSAVKKRLKERYGKLVSMIEQNLSAQLNILDAVRSAYARAAPERRAFANAMQRRRTLVSSLLDAYESFVISNGGTPLENCGEIMAASPTCGLLPDAVLAERCAKGLDFYQRLLTNVSKLLQRVKGTCQVQTEQRDQMIKQHQKWEATTQQMDDDSTATVGGLDDLLAAVSGIDDQDHQQDDLAALIKSFGGNGGSNKPVAPLGSSHWDEQHNHLRRLSPLGSEQQQQQKQYYHQYRHNQIQLPPSSSFNPNDGGIHYYAATYNVAIGSTALTASENSPTSSLPSPLISSSSVPYNYYNYQLLTTKSAVNPALPSPSSYNNIITTATTSGDIDLSVMPMMNALQLSDNNGSSQNLISSYSQSSGNDVFPNAAAAVAVLQRPLSSQYSGIGYGAASGYGYHHPHTLLAPRQQQFYPPQKYQQQNSTTATNADATSVGTAGVFLQQNQQQINSSGLSADIQSPLPMSSPSISTATVNSCSLAAVAQSSSITTNGGTSTVANFYHQFPSQLQQQQYQQQLHQQQQQQHQQQHQQQQQQEQQQQQLKMYQQQQEQKPQQQIPQQPNLYHQQLQPQLYTQQQPQLYQQQTQTPQMYQQLQQQQQPHQLTTSVGSTTGKFYYPSTLQQQTSQLYQTQHQQQLQLQPTSILTTSAVTGSLQQQPSLSNNTTSVGSSYYQQLQQHYSPTTVMSTTTFNTVPNTPNNYIYQHPPMATMQGFNQHQQQSQYYQQQLPIVGDSSGGGNSLGTMTSTAIPILNLLDDDLLISGPPPIQPEKICTSSCNDTITTSTSSNKK